MTLDRDEVIERLEKVQKKVPQILPAIVDTDYATLFKAGKYDARKLYDVLVGAGYLLEDIVQFAQDLEDLIDGK